MSTRETLFYGRAGHIYREQRDNEYYWEPPNSRGIYWLPFRRLWMKVALWMYERRAAKWRKR